MLKCTKFGAKPRIPIVMWCNARIDGGFKY